MEMCHENDKIPYLTFSFGCMRHRKSTIFCCVLVFNIKAKVGVGLRLHCKPMFGLFLSVTVEIFVLCKS